MPITPYALQVKTLDVGNLINNLNAMRQSAQQQQMNALAMEKAKREASQSEAFKNALATGQYKTPEGMNKLMGIDPTSALALRKMLAEEQQTKKSALKTDLDLFSKAAGSVPDTAENYSFLYKGALGDNPDLASYLPHPDQYTPGLMQKFAVGAEALYKRATTESANQARLNAANIRAEATRAAAERTAGRPFDVDGNLVTPSGKVIYQKTPPKEKAPTSVEEYNFYAEQEKQAGRPVKSYEQWVAAKTAPASKGMGGVAGGKTSTQIAKDEAASGAINNLNLIFDKIGPAYEELARQKAISDPTKGVWYNVIAAAKSSETGKALGQAVGSKAAQARNEIDVLTTAFISQLSKATGLTASQLNSNLEFQTFRRMLESKDIVTARESIDLLRGMFAKRIPSSPKEVTQTFGAVNRQMESSKESPESGEAQNRPSLQSIFE